MDAEKLSELLGGNRVDVYVGPGRGHWNLPERLLCHHSPFFSKAFTGNFQEGIDKSIDMEEDDAAVFKLLVQWMFANTIDKPKRIHEAVTGRPQMVRPSPEVEPEVLGKGLGPAGDPDIVDLKGSVATDPSLLWKRAYLGMWVYVKLYVLADKLGMVGLQDHTIDLLRDGTICFFLPKIVVWIYQNTVPSSPLRKCAASLACSALLLHIVVPEYYGAIFASCDEFSTDIMEAFVHQAKEIIYSGEPFHDWTCALHKHRDGEACPRVKRKVNDKDYWNAHRRSGLERMFERRWLDILARCSRDQRIRTASQLRSTLLKDFIEFIDEINDPLRKTEYDRKWKPVPYVPTAVFKPKSPFARRRTGMVTGHS